MKEVYISEPAYIRMQIYDDGEGSFSLDSKTGWFWYGGTDDFLLGLLRVGDSTASEKFLKELKEENITKEDIKKAIYKSLDKNPSDGLYHLLGDNANYMGFDIYDEWIDIEERIKDCLTLHGIDEKKAEDIAKEITHEASYYQPPPSEVFEKKEKEFTEYVPHKVRSWKNVVKKSIEYCDAKYNEIDDFVKCIYDELLPLKEDLSIDFIDSYYAELEKSLQKIDKNKIQEIGNKFNVPIDKIEACLR